MSNNDTTPQSGPGTKSNPASQAGGAAKPASAKALLERSLKEIKKLKAQLRQQELAQCEPLAVIGVGCRFPGGIVDRQSFWEVLKEGKDCITANAEQRWDMDVFYDPDPDAPGKIYSKAMGIIDDPEYFDAEFFGISRREAETMDPQHRLVLETVYEAIEDAGYASAALNGSRTGVFIGIASADYAHLGTRLGNPEQIQPWNGTGNALSAAAGRISYLFNLKGPSVAVDTACSSSLVALHYACQSIRNNDCDSALVGGVNLMLNPGNAIIFSKARMLSPTGACRSFSDDADGYVRSEGAGFVMLKRLSAAEKAGDRILAVIKGTAVNQDGKSQGLTAPNEEAQVDVINAALKAAAVAPDAVGYIESHGTGTPLGDPIELAALQSTYGQARTAVEPLQVGALKTNLGHGEAAAGIAGLIKLTLALHQGKIPPNLHFNKPNAHIPWQTMRIEIPTRLRDWPGVADAPRYGGLSSFGFTGTNAHVVMGAYTSEASSTPAIAEASNEMSHPVETSAAQLVTLSAKTQTGLLQLLQQYQQWLTAPDSELTTVDPELISYTTLLARDHHKYRLAFTVDSPAQWQSIINSTCEQSFNQLAQNRQLLLGEKNKAALKIAFLFPGQGSQYAGMGQALYQRFAVFKKAIDYCAEQLQALSQLSLTELLWGTQSALLNQTRFTQIALFCLEYALAKTWMALGIKPSALLGHSLGEYVAACVAGVFSFKDGLKIIEARGRLMEELTEKGTMVVVSTDEETVKSYLDNTAAISIAAVNADDNVVIAGRQQDIAPVVTLLQEMGVSCKTLDVSHAFHSSLLEPMVDAFRRELETVEFHAPRLSVYSNIDGQKAGHRLTQVSYWVEHLLQTVQFKQCASSIVTDEFDALIEVGPGASLSSLVLGLGPMDLLAVASMKRNGDEPKQFLDAVGKLYARGEDFNWSGLFDADVKRRIDLPHTQFQRKYCWSEAIKLPETKKHFIESSTECLYSMAWERVADSNEDVNANCSNANCSDANISLLPVQHWLLVADKRGRATLLAQALVAAGHQVSCVQLDAFKNTAGQFDGDQFDRHLGGSVLDDSAADDSVPDDSAADGKTGAPLNIVYMASLDFQEPDRYQDFRQAVDVLTESVLQLTQAMQRRTQCSLWLLSHNAVDVGPVDVGSIDVGSIDVSPVSEGLTSSQQGTQLNSTQFILNGFAKSMKLELAEAFRGQIDLQGEAFESVEDTQLQSLVSLLSGSKTALAAETTIALRSGAVYVPRLKRAADLSQLASQSGAVAELAVRPDAHYLIVGGLGSIGLSVADHLITRGAKHLSLVSRRGKESITDQAVLDRLQDYAAKGIQVHCPQVDITNEASLLDLLHQINTDSIPLAGVIHGAGAFDITAIKDLSLEQCLRVMDSKVKGSWLLDRAVAQLTDAEGKPLALDFFVGFSSIASVWGSAGNFHYAAANAAVDGIIQARHNRGEAALAINWGPWAETNMVSADSSTLAQNRGLGLLSHSQGVRLFDWLAGCASGAANTLNQVVVAKVNWAVFKPLLALTGAESLLSHIGNDSNALAIQDLMTSDNLILDEKEMAFKDKLVELDSKQREKSIFNYMLSQLAIALQIDECDIDATQPLINLGIDSLIAVEFRNRLRLLTEIDLPVVKLLEGASLQTLAHYLNEQFESQQRALHGDQGINTAAVDDALASDVDMSVMIEGAL